MSDPHPDDPTPPVSWPVAIAAGAVLVGVLVAFRRWPGILWWLR